MAPLDLHWHFMVRKYQRIASRIPGFHRVLSLRYDLLPLRDLSIRLAKPKCALVPVSPLDFA
jgi:hypothetical protein